MSTKEILKEINRLSLNQRILIIKKTLNSIDKINDFPASKKQTNRKIKNSFNEFFGIYNYSLKKINSDLKKIRTERNRNIDLPA